MTGLTQIDWRLLANEANVRALLEDYISHHKGVSPILFPSSQLALAVWFGKSPQGSEHQLLMLFSGPEMKTIELLRQPLLWKLGQEGPPLIVTHWTSAQHFAQRLSAHDRAVGQYFNKAEVLYFDKKLLPATILNGFGIVTDPPGLIKVWCLSEDQYVKGQTVQSILASRSHVRHDVGIVKTWESEDFESCRALVHVRVDQRWLPSSPEGVKITGFYTDWERGRPGYFLAEGGALYKIIKFEVIHAPQYADLVLEKPRDDRYPEVYLRAVHPPEPPAA